jgi:hypothetical protein
MRRGQVKSDDVIGVEVAKSDSLGGFAHQTAPNYQRVNACTLPFAAVKSMNPSREARSARNYRTFLQSC